MARLLVFLLACYGTTNIITTSRLLRSTRAWLTEKSSLVAYWIRCPMCLAVPVGACWSLVGLSPYPMLGWLGDALVAAAVSSGWCWIVRVLLHGLGEDEL